MPGGSNPTHYSQKSPQPIEVIRAWDLDYLEGNILKYLARWRDKDGIADLKKAQTYLDWLIQEQVVEQEASRWLRTDQTAPAKSPITYRIS